MTNTRVRGRFAPSPTGPLHFGSLVAALGSYLQAKSQGSEWQVRIDDIDTPRTLAGASDDILRTLEAYGFVWDGEVVYQSRRAKAYEAALEVLHQRQVLYACGCSRKEIADSGILGIEGPVYPGTCRRGVAAERVSRAWRVRVDNIAIEFHDVIQGPQRSQLEHEIGDFVVQRADGLYAYQLACAVDDGEQGMTEVVRGVDLLPSTARQIHLQRLLGLPTPAYIHLPVVVNAKGEKLSKQTRAAPLSRTLPVATLWRALDFLGQTPPPAWQKASLAEFWSMAQTRWKLDAVPRQVSIAI